mgnify:CR=1 FL=1
MLGRVGVDVVSGGAGLWRAGGAAAVWSATAAAGGAAGASSAASGAVTGKRALGTSAWAWEEKTEDKVDAEKATEEATEIKTENEAQVEQESSSESSKADHDAAAAKVAELEEKMVEMKENLLRALADQENVRIRAREDVESARKFGVTKFAKSMLDVADSIEKAMEAANEAEHGALYEGIAMTYKQLYNAFAANGIEPVRPLGEPFNPELHQALFEMPAGGEHEPGHVGIVTRTGYTLNSRILRPAQVGVVAQPLPEANGDGSNQ